MIEKLSFTPKEAAAATGVAYTRIRQAIAEGEIEVRLSSPKRYVVMRAELERWLQSLPTEAKSA